MKLFIAIALFIAGLGAWGYFHLAEGPESIVIENDSATTPEAQTDEHRAAGDTDAVSPAEPVPQVGTTLPAEPKPAAVPPRTETAPAGKPIIVDRKVSFGFEAPSKPRSIDTVILHSSYNPFGGDVHDVGKIIGIYQSYGVAPHYIIGRDGTIYRTVDERNIAYHAGVAKMPDGRTGINAFSIGIELVNTEQGEYTEKQYAAVNALLADIRSRYQIRSVLGHDAIAPGRKTDPWNLDWQRIKR